VPAQRGGQLSAPCPLSHARGYGQRVCPRAPAQGRGAWRMSMCRALVARVPRERERNGVQKMSAHFFFFFAACALRLPSIPHHMDALLSAFSTRPDTGGVEFWHGAERSGWLMKQGDKRRRGICVAALASSPRLLTFTRTSSTHSGELIKTWRRRCVGKAGDGEGREAARARMEGESNVREQHARSAVYNLPLFYFNQNPLSAGLSSRTARSSGSRQTPSGR